MNSTTMCTQRTLPKDIFASNWQLFAEQPPAAWWLESWQKFKAGAGMASPGTVNISAADQKDLEKVRIGFRRFFIPISVHKVPGGESCASGGAGSAGRASHCPKVSQKFRCRFISHPTFCPLYDALNHLTPLYPGIYLTRPPPPIFKETRDALSK